MYTKLFSILLLFVNTVRIQAACTCTRGITITDFLATCSNTETQISCSSKYLTGPFPNDAFYRFTQLTDLYLSSNQFTGTIPSFENNTKLENLYLNDNQLTGEIPKNAFENNTELRYLYLYNTQLTGPIPDFSKNTELIELYLHGNELTGPIPDFSKNTQLADLYLKQNNGFNLCKSPDYPWEWPSSGFNHDGEITNVCPAECICKYSTQ